MTKTCTQESGTCKACQDGCDYKPGWFLPGEAEKAAKLLGLSMPDFFRKYLAVDWIDGGKRATFVLSPALTTSPAGEEMPARAIGRCVFFKNHRCRIHAAKPHECKEAWCGEEYDGKQHKKVGLAWRGKPQGQIRALLGREPKAREFTTAEKVEMLLTGRLSW